MSDQDRTIPRSQRIDLSHRSENEYKYRMLYSGDIIKQKYQIIQELGSGGFATTYLAIDILSTNSSKCVIKQLQPRFNSPSIWENAKERLETEGLILKKLGRHEQIPQLLDHFEENKQLYLVLEFIDGEDFAQEVQKKILNEVEVIKFLQEVLKILDFVHQQGVIHRDIKPSNLIRSNQEVSAYAEGVTPSFADRKVTLIDFGAVKEIGTTILQLPLNSSRNTLSTQVIGTPGYMPPEQNNGKPVFSSDIYALGKTAIYALTGKSPIEWEQMELDEAIYWYDKVNISPGLTKLIRRMIAPKTSERFTSVTQVLKALNPLSVLGQVLENRYSIIEYLNSENFIDYYIVRDCQDQEKTRYFISRINILYFNRASQSIVKKNIKKFIEKFKKVEKHHQLSLIKNYFEDQNYYYLVQEYIPGKTLEQLIENTALFTEDMILKLIENIAIALSACHQLKIIHGNIRPSSLIQSQDRELIMLQNFNITGKLTNSFTDKNVINLSYADDIYNLGMTAIYALTGIVPEKLAKNPHTEQILWENNLQISNNLITLINRMISLEQHDHYQSAEEVIWAVKRIKFRSKFRLWYLYLLSVPLLLISVLFMVAQWTQRTAILEFYKADIMLEGQEYDMAIEYYDAGLQKLFKTKKQVKHFNQVWLKKATAYNRLKNYQGALETCNQALQYYQSYQLWNCQGLALDGLQRYQEAIIAYNKAIALEPEYLWLWNNRGEVYAKLGQVKNAISDFRQAIAINQEQSFVPWNNLGKLYYQQQQYQKAIVTYQKAIAVKEDYVPALIGLGNCYKDEKKYALALETYNQVIKIDNYAYEAWLGKGLVEESLARYAEAARTYQQALNIREDGEDGAVVQQALERVLKQLQTEERHS